MEKKPTPRAVALLPVAVFLVLYLVLVYDSITQQDVLDFIRENFVESHMALSVIHPKEG